MLQLKSHQSRTVWRPDGTSGRKHTHHPTRGGGTSDFLILTQSGILCQSLKQFSLQQGHLTPKKQYPGGAPG